MKTFTYEEITAKAEAKITEYIAQAKSGPDEYINKMRRDWATGVYFGWYAITCGQQKDGDDERLYALTEAK